MLSFWNVTPSLSWIHLIVFVVLCCIHLYVYIIYIIFTCIYTYIYIENAFHQKSHEIFPWTQPHLRFFLRQLPTSCNRPKCRASVPSCLFPPSKQCARARCFSETPVGVEESGSEFQGQFEPFNLRIKRQVQEKRGNWEHSNIIMED